MKTFRLSCLVSKVLVINILQIGSIPSGRVHADIVTATVTMEASSNTDFK
jgi:hypothetical protein